jgi:hypothetical protein
MRIRLQRSSEIIRNAENQIADTKEKTQNVQPDPVKYLKQQMLVMDSLEKARDPNIKANWQQNKGSKPIRKRWKSFLIPHLMSANQELTACSMLL